MSPKILQETVLHAGWGRFKIVKVRLTSGQEVDREVEDHGSAVCVLPYDPERKVATFVRQFRPAIFSAGGPTELLEAPAGILEDAPEDCARREALEETGIRLHELEPVVSGWTSPGVSTECMHCYLATYGAADRIGEGGGLAEEHEDIEVVELPLRDVAAMAAAGEITDMKTLAVVLALQLRRPELFT
jgi:nudix-type nucleoside diphosphatase (YffH/AdpP family)